MANLAHYLELVPAPPDVGVNTGLNPCDTKELVAKFGYPRPKHLLNDQKCLAVTNKFWKDQMETRVIAPFDYKVTGHHLFLDVLELAMADLRVADPDLYDLVNHAGCLCCRFVRGSNSSVSNHALGLAIDFTIGGQLDTLGDEKVMRGMLILYSILKKYKLWWGVEYKREDGMHFEASKQLVDEWIKSGKFTKRAA
jgi:hypothetical protein